MPKKLQRNKKLIEDIQSLSRYKEPKGAILILKRKYKKNNSIYLGVKHGSDDNKFIKKYITRQFKDFIKEVDKKNILVIIEGPKFESKEKTKTEDLFKKYRESGYIIPLSLKNNIEIRSVEPTEDEIIKSIKNRNPSRSDKKNIGSWILANYILSKTKHGEIIGNEKNNIQNLLVHLNRELEISVKRNYKTNSIYQTLAKNLNHHAHNQLLPNNIESVNHWRINKRKLRNIQTPTSEKTKINQIGILFNQIRDFLIVNQITKLWNKKNIFIIYGMNHLVCQLNFLTKYKNRGEIFSSAQIFTDTT